VQGGSTITQQLIKNMTKDADVRIQRKIQEILSAMYLERRTSKEEIFETYVNIVNLSGGCYGVQAAANTFFNKDVSELNLIECAAIAAIVQSPTTFNPIRRPEKNKERRDVCLGLMLEQGLITQEEFDDAHDKELMINRPENSYVETVKSYYVDQVIEDVKKDLMKEKGFTEWLALQYIYSGGLKIYTCMDKFIQTVMETVYTDDKYFPPQKEGAIKFQSAMVVLDPYNGNLLGIVGGRGEKEGQRVLNRASKSERQPGSSIKPVSVYAPALEYGVIDWGTPLKDTYVKKVNGNWWPTNLPNTMQGQITLYDAIKVSKNTTAAHVLQKLTPEKSYEFLTQRVGITTLVESETKASGQVLTDLDLAPLALGGLTYGMTVYELTNAYTMFVNEGIYSKSRSYIKVTDAKDNVVLDNQLVRIPAISAENACIMTKLLMGVVEEGTAKGLDPAIKDRIQVAGKTGTAGTEKADYDRWFIGYTPYYLCGAWFGYDQPKILNVGVGAENPPLKLWAYVMKAIHENLGLFNNPIKFPTAPGVIEARYCRDSGMSPTPNCPTEEGNYRVSMGYFALGSEPMEPCIIHGVEVKTTEEPSTEEPTTEEVTTNPIPITEKPIEKPTEPPPLITQPPTEPTIVETTTEMVNPSIEQPTETPTQEITMEEITIGQEEPDIITEPGNNNAEDYIIDE
jgi:penicillin-binding protein 1A